MVADGSAEREAAARAPAASGDAAPEWLVRPAEEADAASRWPVYDGRSGDATVGDGVVAERPEAPRPRRPGPVIALAVSAAVVMAGIGAALVREPTPDTAGSRSAPQPEPVFAGPQWTPVDASLTAGLVRVQVTASIEADGLVMNADGLVATSYARLAGLNGSDASVEAVELNVVADGGMPMPAQIVGFDPSRDVAVLRVPGYRPSSVITPGTPVADGDALTVLDDLGDGDPVVGFPVTVDTVEQRCWRPGAAMIGRPDGFGFQLDSTAAEPGGAIVRADGTVVGMYFGGQETRHCGVPIAEVAEVVRTVARGVDAATTRVGPPGGLGFQLYGPDDAYPAVTSLEWLGGPLENAGLKVGDLITRVGKVSLRRDDLTTLGPSGVIRMLEPGQEVTVEWLSDGVARRATVPVGEGAQPRG